MQERLKSLDIFRGMTVAAMILVNNPGSWDDDYPPLLHSQWNGCTAADLIFPFFIFIAGVAIPLSRRSREDKGATKGDLARHIGRRTILLVALGLLVTWFTGYDWRLPPDATLLGSLIDHLRDWRFPGVLQRIGLVYGAAALMDLYGTTRSRTALGIGLLLFYWAAMMLIPVPGTGLTGLAALDVPNATLAAYVDRGLFDWGAWGNHLWYFSTPSGTWDPEGALSTIPAIASGLLGVAAGRWLQRPIPLEIRFSRLAMAGFVGVLLGYLWDMAFPINKALWTSSFVVFTAGFAALALSALGWLADLRGIHRWAEPFKVFGVNAILAYAGDEIVGSILYKVGVIPAESGPLDLLSAFYQMIILPRFEPRDASLIFALSMVLFWGGILTLFYRRGIYLKL
jgi:predicted acyltransferase